jgi:hypothetical protein
MSDPNKVICPCIDCLMIPICRHREFDELMRTCRLVLQSLYYHNVPTDGNRSRDYSKKITLMIEYIKPLKWHATIGNDGFAHIHHTAEKGVMYR